MNIANYMEDFIEATKNIEDNFDGCMSRISDADARIEELAQEADRIREVIEGAENERHDAAHHFESQLDSLLGLLELVAGQLKDGDDPKAVAANLLSFTTAVRARHWHHAEGLVY